MPDFRSRQERESAHRGTQAEQADYKRMYEQVMAENAAFRSQLDKISADHHALQQQMQSVFKAFDTHRQSVGKQIEDMQRLSRAVEDMVTNSYQQNQRLMEKYQTDISDRLASLRQQAHLEDLT